jgi:DNA ligase-1
MKISQTSETLYKLDSKGKVRVWYAETGTDGTRWGVRSVSGLEDGLKVTSEWSFVEQKNVGRSNETSLEDQAISEMESEVQKKKDRGYFSDLNKIDTFDKFKPMLAENFEETPLDWKGGYVFCQPKLDGIRCIARKDGLWTRSGKEIPAVPHIWDSLKGFFDKYPHIILDGELYNHELKDDFNSITSMVRKTKPKPEDFVKSKELVQYHVYDTFVITEPDMPFRKRELLRYEASNEFVKIVPTMQVENLLGINSLYEGYLEHGYEGQMVRVDTKYENKRSKVLLKRKEFITAEFEVIEMLEGQGNWQGAVKHFVLPLNAEKNFQAGVRGDMLTLRNLLEDGQKPEWVTLRYFTPTPDGVPRFPVVIDWGFGKRED